MQRGSWSTRWRCWRGTVSIPVPVWIAKTCGGCWSNCGCRRQTRTNRRFRVAATRRVCAATAGRRWLFFGISGFRAIQQSKNVGWDCHDGESCAFSACALTGREAVQELTPRSAWTLFIVSIVLLGGLAFYASQSAENYTDSERWVSHTREVEWQLALLRSELAISALQARGADEAALRPAAVSQPERQVETQIAEIQRLTEDNPVQQASIGKLASLLRPAVTPLAAAGTAGNATLQQETSLLDQMQNEEERLLAARQLVSQANYHWLQSMLTVALLVVLGLMSFIFSTLLAQLAMRGKAEKSVRRLSAHILDAQDTERRRLARELQRRKVRYRLYRKLWTAASAWPNRGFRKRGRFLICCTRRCWTNWDSSTRCGGSWKDSATAARSRCG